MKSKLPLIVINAILVIALITAIIFMFKFKNEFAYAQAQMKNLNNEMNGLRSELDIYRDRYYREENTEQVENTETTEKVEQEEQKIPVDTTDYSNDLKDVDYEVLDDNSYYSFSEISSDYDPYIYSKYQARAQIYDGKLQVSYCDDEVSYFFQEVTGLQGNPVSAVVSVYGQSMSHDTYKVIILMEDGTVEYLKTSDMRKGIFKSAGKIGGLNNIVRIVNGAIGTYPVGGYSGAAAIGADGTVYILKNFPN